MPNLRVRPNQSGLRAGPLECFQKKSRSLCSVEIGGLEVSEAGRVLGEAEAEVSYGVVLAAEAAAEAEEAIRALSTSSVCDFCEVNPFIFL
jgi:hypothetical protein